MSARFVNVDHDTPLLLPPDLRDWVSRGHMVHFIMEVVVALDPSLAHTNERGIGRAQYPPSMMHGLLIYRYATGSLSSRRIEKLTRENLAVRLLTGNTHPDHDSICKFRCENKSLLSDAFHQVLELAALARIAQLGVRVDPPPPTAGARVAGLMVNLLETEQGKGFCGLRKQTVEQESLGTLNIELTTLKLRKGEETQAA